MQRTAEAISEELLALRCRRGEKAALEELVRTWEKRLFYFIRRLVDNEADAWDVLQETWARPSPECPRSRLDLSVDSRDE